MGCGCCWVPGPCEPHVPGWDVGFWLCWTHSALPPAKAPAAASALLHPVLGAAESWCCRKAEGGEGALLWMSWVMSPHLVCALRPGLCPQFRTTGSWGQSSCRHNTEEGGGVDEAKWDAGRPKGYGKNLGKRWSPPRSRNPNCSQSRPSGGSALRVGGGHPGSIAQGLALGCRAAAGAGTPVLGGGCGRRGRAAPREVARCLRGAARPAPRSDRCPAGCRCPGPERGGGRGRSGSAGLRLAECQRRRRRREAGGSGSSEAAAAPAPAPGAAPPGPGKGFGPRVSAVLVPVASGRPCGGARRAGVGRSGSRRGRGTAVSARSRCRESRGGWRGAGARGRHRAGGRGFPGRRRRGHQPVRLRLRVRGAGERR